MATATAMGRRRETPAGQSWRTIPTGPSPNRPPWDPTGGGEGEGGGDEDGGAAVGGASPAGAGRGEDDDVGVGVGYAVVYDGSLSSRSSAPPPPKEDEVVADLYDLALLPSEYELTTTTQPPPSIAAWMAVSAILSLTDMHSEYLRYRSGRVDDDDDRDDRYDEYYNRDGYGAAPSGADRARSLRLYSKAKGRYSIAVDLEAVNRGLVCQGGKGVDVDVDADADVDDGGEVSDQELGRADAAVGVDRTLMDLYASGLNWDRNFSFIVQRGR